MSHHPQRVIDSDTGEFTGLIVEPRQPVRAPRRGAERGWVRVFQGAFMERVVVEPRLTVVEWEVWHALLDALHYDECFGLNVTDLARALRRDRATVHRSLQRLIDRGMVHRDPEQPTCYWLDPDLAWKGNPGERKRQRARVALV